MAKKVTSKKKIIDPREEREKAFAEKSLHIPVTIIDALLAAHDTGNRVAVSSIMQQIREIAEDEIPEVYKTHRHSR